MQERLLEVWLDSASERSYQAPFCQVLLGRGETVLHSTRHSQIEFGKDVISVGRDGTLNAYQLKGNPGSRLTLNQFRGIQGQLLQLATGAIVRPGHNAQRHQPFLVTNGEVDEEAQRALDDLNRGLPEGCHGIRVISRGTLLSWFREQADDFWPHEISDLGILLRMLALTGREQPPLQELHKLLEAMLLLAEGSAASSKAEVRRRITSAGVTMAVALRSFGQMENHYSIAAAWVMFATYIIGAGERHSLDSNDVAPSIDLALGTALSHLHDLIDEASGYEIMALGNSLADFAMYRARTTLVVGLASCVWLWHERGGVPWTSNDSCDSVARFIKKHTHSMELWGEGAVPQFLACAWQQQNVDPTPSPNIGLATVCETLCRAAVNSETAPFASPYYSFEDVTKHRFARVLGGDDPMAEESARGSSFFAESVFHLVVQTGLKQHAKGLWPGLTRVGTVVFEPQEPWQFCTWRRENDGRQATRQLPRTEQWENVVTRARTVSTPEMPNLLRNYPILLLLFTIVCPHRATGNVLRFLGYRLGTFWFRDGPID